MAGIEIHTILKAALQNHEQKMKLSSFFSYSVLGKKQGTLHTRWETASLAKLVHKKYRNPSENVYYFPPLHPFLLRGRRTVFKQYLWKIGLLVINFSNDKCTIQWPCCCVLKTITGRIVLLSPSQNKCFVYAQKYAGRSRLSS